MDSLCYVANGPDRYSLALAKQIANSVIGLTPIGQGQFGNRKGLCYNLITMLLPTMEQYYPDQPQPYIDDGGLTSTHVSQLQFRHENRLYLVPGRHMVVTRSECSRVTWHKVIAHQPPSHARVAQAFAISGELKQMPRDQLVELARAAKGSLKAPGENAAAVVRRLRDEWDDSD